MRSRSLSSFALIVLTAGLSIGFSASSLLAQTATESVIYNFCSLGGTSCTDGEEPLAGLIQGSDGNFYGTTQDGGANNGGGSAFKVTPAGILTTLYSFCAEGGNSCTDGANPNTALLPGGDANFYGTTMDGGTGDGGEAFQGGTIFKLTPGGSLTTVFNFCSQVDCADGEYPEGLIVGSDGNLYGTTQLAGANGDGTVFSLTPAGVFNTLYAFCAKANCVDGDEPYAGLVQGSDGNFYGTTQDGGAFDQSNGGAGTVFKITTAGALTTIYSFCSKGGSGCTDGAFPQAGLVEGSDGNFYGTTESGGSAGAGTAFKITPAGVLTTLHSFPSTGGNEPVTALAAGSDGNFYGTTSVGDVGGVNDSGTAFVITPAGGFTNLYNFCSEGGSSCTDGAFPAAGLLQGSDGNFYGTTVAGGMGGGVDGGGVVYKLTISPGLAMPVQLTVSESSVTAGTAVTLSWEVLNAFSLTAQQCYAYVQNGETGAGTWTGKQAGTYNATTKLLSGSASITPTAAGTYTYALTCGGQESGFATLTVTAKLTATTTLSSSINPVTVGQNFLLTSTVSGSGATPTGTVTFLYGSTVLKVANLQSGVATDTVDAVDITTIPVGKYKLTASYSGDANYSASTSAGYTVTLNPAPTATTMTAMPATVTPPANVTFTATVKRSTSGATGTPAGTVTFYYQTVVLGKGNLNASGVATLTQSTNGVPAGTYGITAKYNGDANDVTSQTSAPVNVTVQ